MADLFDPRTRSRIMSAIRSSGTQPEKRLFAIVAAIAGRRTILQNVRALPGCPDIVVPSLRIALFAHGCFYHCCSKHGHLPKTNKAYWRPKLLRNVQRDVRNIRILRKSGYSVWCIWEHALHPSEIERTTRYVTRIFAIARRRRRL